MRRGKQTRRSKTQMGGITGRQCKPDITHSWGSVQPSLLRLLNKEREMEDYQRRVIDEKKELDKKREALNKFFKTNIFIGRMTSKEKVRLDYQSRVMNEYSKVLGDRIEDFK